MKSVLFAFILVFFSVSVFATGGTYCYVDNDEVMIEVSLTNGHMFGAPLVPNSNVNVVIKKSPLVVSLNEYTFDVAKNEIPYWYNLGGKLNLGAFVEPTQIGGLPVDAYIMLAVKIEAQYNENSREYEGIYTVTQKSNSIGPGAQEWNNKGFITCEAE